MWVASLALLVGLSSPASVLGEPHLSLPKVGLAPDELALVINEADPLSVRIGAYYRERRHIPDANVLMVRLPRLGTNLAPEEFRRLKEDLDRRTPETVQAYALAWTTPYRVGCMSITSAFALGYDRAYCSTGCGPTRPSGYFDSFSAAPFRDLRIRPAILLAGRNFDAVKSLIDRGVLSDFTYPRGTGYLLTTSDRTRSVRALGFGRTVAHLGEAFRLQSLAADFIRGKLDVLFYFTGLERVQHLETLRFLPGALADHLTSTGGQLTDSSQMSSLRWLEAGATGSYGTVVEPCNHLQKFPYPEVAMWHYAAGNTLIEAYWKSVGWPGEGVFIGEPLARPFGFRVTAGDQRGVDLDVFSPVRRALWLQVADSPMGPFRMSDLHYRLEPGLNHLKIRLPNLEQYFRAIFGPLEPALQRR